MPKDNNLYLIGSATAGSALSSSTNSTAIDVTGGDIAVVHIYSSVTPTDSDETIAFVVQASVDGTNYGTIGAFPTFSKAANKGNAGTYVAVPVYIPRSENNPDGRGVHSATKLRLNYTVGGTTPSYTVQAWVSPLGQADRGGIAGFTSGNAARRGPLDAVGAWCT